MDRFYRTPEKQRTKYKYFTEDGRSLCTIGALKDTDIDVVIDTRNNEIRLYDSVNHSLEMTVGIDEAWLSQNEEAREKRISDLKKEAIKKRAAVIALLHRMDDADVYRNNKERKLDPFSQEQYEKVKEKFIEEFRERHGRDPRKEELPEGSHRQFVSIDAVNSVNGEERNAECTKLFETLATDPFREEETPVTIMDQIIQSEEFSDKERIVYDCKVHQDMTDAETGKVLDTTGQYAGRLWNRIIEKIKNNPEMQKFYRF